AAGTTAAPNNVGVALAHTVGNVISTCVISGNTTGIAIVNGATASIVSNNTIGLNAALSNPVPNANGMVLSGDHNNTIDGNVIVGNLGMGLYAVNASTGDQIKNNNIANNHDFGLSLVGAGTSGNTVSSNFISANGTAGVVLAAGAAGNIIGGVAAAGAN